MSSSERKWSENGRRIARKRLSRASLSSWPIRSRFVEKSTRRWFWLVNPRVVWDWLCLTSQIIERRARNFNLTKPHQDWTELFPGQERSLKYYVLGSHVSRITSIWMDASSSCSLTTSLWWQFWVRKKPVPTLAAVRMQHWGMVLLSYNRQVAVSIVQIAWRCW